MNNTINNILSKIKGTGASLSSEDEELLAVMLEAPHQKTVSVALQPIKTFDLMRTCILCMMAYLASIGFNVCITVSGYDKYSKKGLNKQQMLDNAENAVLFYSQFFTESFPRKIWQKIEFVSDVVLRYTSNAERDRYAFELINLMHRSVDYPEISKETKVFVEKTNEMVREIFYERFWNINPHIVWGRKTSNDLRAFLQVKKEKEAQRVVFLNSTEFENNESDIDIYKKFFELIEDCLLKKQTAEAFLEYVNRRSA